MNRSASVDRLRRCGGVEGASEALVGNVACGTTEPSRLSCDAVRRDGYVSQACA